MLLADALGALFITETAMFCKFTPGPTAQFPPDPGDGVAEATDDRRQQPHHDRGQIQEIYGKKILIKNFNFLISKISEPNKQNVKNYFTVGNF